MTLDHLVFVSKRASVAAAALLCLSATHLAQAVMQAKSPALAQPLEVRVAVGR